MDAQQIVTLMASGGGGAALVALITGLVKWISGSSARERVRATDIITQRRNAINERIKADEHRNEADQKRRISDEYSSSLRRQLFEAGIEPLPWPKQKHEPQPNEDS